MKAAGMLYGLPVIVNDASYPHMSPSPEFCRLQSPKLVAETAAWMRQRFGGTPLIPDGQVTHDKINGRLYMNSTTLRQLEAALITQRFATKT